MTKDTDVRNNQIALPNQMRRSSKSNSGIRNAKSTPVRISKPSYIEQFLSYFKFAGVESG